jgi:hypothetical protein
MTTWKTIVGPAALVALLASSSTSLGAVVSIRKLPNGPMTKIPASHSPSHVAAGARIGGLFVAQAPPTRGAPNYKRIDIVDSERDAASFSRKGFVEATASNPLGSKQCVFVTDDTSQPGDAWPVLARGEITAFAGSGQRPILGVHVENLDEDGASSANASLRIVDAWLDTRTRGLKLIEKATVPLQTVTEGPFGIRVLAAKSDDAVHFVVLPPPPGKDSATFGGQFDRGIIEAGGEVGLSQCAHSRVTLNALPGSGERAVVSFQHLERAPREPADGKPEDATEEARRVDAFGTSRTRLVQVHLSASRNATASEPIVSVTFRVDKAKPFGS